MPSPPCCSRSICDIRQDRRSGRRGYAANHAVDHLCRECSTDKVPIIALQLPLTDEQQKRIAASVAKSSAAPVGHLQLLQEFPAGAVAAVPEIERYKYVQLPDRVLIVDPPFWIVVGEIKK